MSSNTTWKHMPRKAKPAGDKAFYAAVGIASPCVIYIIMAVFSVTTMGDYPK